jgi:hypothetical protein
LRGCGWRLDCGRRLGFAVTEAEGSYEGNCTETVNGDGADDYEEGRGEELVRSADAEADERS